MTQTFLLSLKDGVSVERPEPAHLSLRAPEVSGSPRIALNLRQLSPALETALTTLSGRGASRDELNAAVLEGDGPTGLFRLQQCLNEIAGLGLLCHSVTSEAGPLARLVPLSDRQVLQERDLGDGAWILSRFASLRRDGDRMILECPLGHARILLHRPEAVAFLAALSRPGTPATLAREVPAIPEASGRLLLALLRGAGALSEVDAAGAVAEDAGPVLPQWEFHDLLFHSRSRVGRHGSPVGGTYRFEGVLPPLPVVRPRPEGERIRLERPDIEALVRADRSFTAVVESRASIREQGDRPLSVGQLGELLYRAARIKQHFRSDKGEVTTRPYPGGGALYELEIYPVVDRCEGLAGGLYHYAPLEHELTRLPAREEPVRSLLEMAWYTADRRSRPQVLLVLTARFQRIQWKYQSVSYAVILKDVGVMFQNLYLVATAMDLAPCALGGGNADLFAQAAGLDYYVETSVGEFILGSRGEPEHVA